MCAVLIISFYLVYGIYATVRNKLGNFCENAKTENEKIHCKSSFQHDYAISQRFDKVEKNGEEDELQHMDEPDHVLGVLLCVCVVVLKCVTYQFRSQQ